MTVKAMMNIYEYNNICCKKCPETTKTFEEQKLCLDECYPEQFEYNNICYNDCPENSYRIFIDRNKCVIKIPDNYYLDIEDNIYKNVMKDVKVARNLEMILFIIVMNVQMALYFLMIH